MPDFGPNIHTLRQEQGGLTSIACISSCQHAHMNYMLLQYSLSNRMGSKSRARSIFPRWASPVWGTGANQRTSKAKRESVPSTGARRGGAELD